MKIAEKHEVPGITAKGRKSPKLRINARSELQLTGRIVLVGETGLASEFA